VINDNSKTGTMKIQKLKISGYSEDETIEREIRNIHSITSPLIRNLNISVETEEAIRYEAKKYNNDCLVKWLAACFERLIRSDSILTRIFVYCANKPSMEHFV